MGSNMGGEDERSENAMGPMISIETFTKKEYLYVTVCVYIYIHMSIFFKYPLEPILISDVIGVPVLSS